MTNDTRRGEGSASRPGRFLLPGKTRYPLYRRLGAPQGRSGQVRKISPPPGFDPRIVQPVASRYTDWATRPTISGPKQPTNYTVIQFKRLILQNLSSSSPTFAPCFYVTGIQNFDFRLAAHMWPFSIWLDEFGANKNNYSSRCSG